MAQPFVNQAEQLREQLNSGTKEIAEAHRFDEAALTRWLEANVEGFAGPLTVRQFKGGQSNPTFQLVTPSQTYVMRRKPPGRLLPSAHAVDREFRVISALWPTGFPVARPYGLCTDESVVGAMFYVMQMVEGRILWDQSLPSYAPAQRREIYLAQLTPLARLHTTDYRAVGLEDFGRPGNYMARQVDRWSKQYRASETERQEIMERLMEWLPLTCPDDPIVSIVHGDYRLDNMILHPTEPRVTAVLDWELSTLGSGIADFAYFLMQWVSGPLSLIPDPAAHGLPSVEEMAAEYCRLTGRTSLPDLNWYFAYGQFRMAAIVQGIIGRVRDGTANSPQAAQQAGRLPGLLETAWRYAEKAGA
jgi:aminoglycoside phosphotransferase (APT) family kinase protein